MPKNNNSKAKSARKPLVDISNGVKSSKPSGKKKVSDHEDKDGYEAALDRLLLAHSDLSNLIHQIDELVVQALKVKQTSKKGRKEIESFTHVLSDMHFSLKSWVPRFQKVLSSPLVESDNQLGQSLPSKTDPNANEEMSDAADSPEQLELGSLVSPSPLVSWCADRTVESGRQLFLLTPMPRSKVFSSKCQGSSRSVFERITCMDALPNTTLGIPSLFTISGNTNDDLLEGIELKQTPNKFSNSIVTEMDGPLECGFVSPPKFSSKDHSMFLMTPRVKMSPPKSCVLLEPIRESYNQDHNDIPKSTPFPVGIENHSGSQMSEPSSSHVSESLALKYPELFGLQATQKWGVGRKEIEASFDWFMSPPKTCVVMEPPDKNLSINADTKGNLSSIGCVLNEQSTSLIATRNKDVQGACQSKLLSASVALESTPMWKEPESTIRTGKLPGENTLKKELWTKFEAASSNVMRFDVSVLRETAGKGFLDRLEEVSSEETSLVCKDLR